MRIFVLIFHCDSFSKHSVPLSDVLGVGFNLAAPCCANSCGDSLPIWDHVIGFFLIELTMVILSLHLNMLFASHGKTNVSEWLAKTKGRSGCQFSSTYGAMVNCPMEGMLHPTLVE